MAKPKYSNDYKDWYERAKHDIDDAQLLLREGGHSDTICYLAHQAVEKYLKGFLLMKKIDYPFIHDLVKLLRLCSKFDKSIIDYLDECKTINSYYIDERYPLGTLRDYPKEEVEKAIEMAKGVIKYIKDKTA